MRTARLIRAPWPYGVLLCCYLAAAFGAEAVTTPDPYRLALTANVTSALFVIAPIVAALAAFQGGRWRGGGWDHSGSARSGIRIATGPVAKCALVGVAGLSVGLALKWRSERPGGGPDAVLVALAVLVLIAHAALGWSVGTRAAPVLAVPAVLAFDFAWMALPVGYPPLWLRHLNGAYFSCCNPPESLSGRAVAATALVALGMLGAAALLRNRDGGLHRAWAVLPVGAAVGLAAIPAHLLGPDPTKARTTGLVCAGSATVLCLWEEHEALRPRVGETVSDVSRVWSQANLRLPEKLSEELPSASQSGVGALAVSTLASREEIALAVSDAFLPASPPLCAAEPGVTYDGALARENLLAWLALGSSVPKQLIAVRVSRQAADVATRVQAAAAVPQQEWALRALDVVRTCGMRTPVPPSK